MNKKVLFLITFLYPSFLFSYDWPLKPFAGPHDIHGKVGEFRPGLRIHSGVDMGFVGNPVHAVKDGVVTEIDKRGLNDEELIIRGIYGYTHIKILPTIDVGTVISKNQLIGHIKSGPNHLHFTEIGENPLRVGGLKNYKDREGTVVKNVVLVDPNTNLTIDLSQPITIKEVKIRANARDEQTTGSDTTGVYEIGYEIFDNTTKQLILNEFPTQRYDSSAGKATIAYDTRLSNKSNYEYWVTNSQFKEQVLDLTSLRQADEYKLCVLAKDIKGNAGSKCELFKVEKSTDCSNDIINPNISYTNFESCVNTNDVEITGIANDNCELSAVTVNGVSAVISSNTFTASLTLQDGNHVIKAIATDISGNSAMVEENLNVDTVAPNPLTFTPPNGAINVQLDSPISVTFDEEIETGQLVVGGLSGGSILSGDTLSFNHGGLAKKQSYTARADGVKDNCGNDALPTSWFFTAAAFKKKLQPPQDNNGQPIDPNKWINTDSITQCGSVDNSSGPAVVSITVTGGGGTLFSDSKNLPQGQGNFFFTFDGNVGMVDKFL